ncbi:MAG: hypothetical protein AABX48_01430, partial [Nanoarchaeota archaeon]
MNKRVIGVFVFSVLLIGLVSAGWFDWLTPTGKATSTGSVSFSTPNSTSSVTQGVAVRVIWQGTGVSSSDSGYLFLYNSSGSMIYNPYQDYINRNMVINGWNLPLSSGSFAPTLRNDLPSGSYKLVIADYSRSTIYGQTDFFNVGSVSSSGKVVSVSNSNAVNNCNGVVTVSCTTDGSTNSIFPYYIISNSGVLQGQFATTQSG